jgi:hypothetical protein
MRNELEAALQARWEASLRARAAFCARSPVLLLDALLAPLRGAASESTADPAESLTLEVGSDLYKEPLSWSNAAVGDTGIEPVTSSV